MDRKLSLQYINVEVVDNRLFPSSGASRLKILLVQTACKSNGTETYHLPFQLILTVHVTRSYYKGVELGYLTEDPAAYHDIHVCDPYIKTS